MPETSASAAADTLRKRRRGRIARAVLLALAFAPGLWLRDAGSEVSIAGNTVAARLPLPAQDIAPGLTLLGAWQLTNRNPSFGGYSALIAQPGGRLQAFSDIGRSMAFGDPDRGLRPVRFGVVPPLRPGGDRARDVESATWNPRTGTVWVAAEDSNAIRRHASGAQAWDFVRPPSMRRWPSNQGPETMVRLSDGRFLVLAEARENLSARAGPALLFPGDPLRGGKPVRFRFAPPDGFRPVDAASLPDGRVVILLRKLKMVLPPSFRSRLVIADPAQIKPGELWSWRPVARIEPPLPRDNYEGLAIVPGSDGSVVLWLISDDNRAAYLQRTLLLKIRWDVPPPAIARGG